MVILPASPMNRVPPCRDWLKNSWALALVLALVVLSLPTLAKAQVLNVGAVDTSQMRNYARRIVLPVRLRRNVIFDQPVTSLIVIDPKLVAAEAKAQKVSFLGLAAGETMVIVVIDGQRITYAVEVTAEPVITIEQIEANAARSEREMFRPAGSLSFTFSPALSGGPTTLRHGFDYRRNLGNRRTLRIESDMFKLFGGGPGLAYAAAAHFGINRVRLGVSSSGGEFDLLDSELNITPLSFNGYTMRGLHLASTAGSRWRGMEIFAGLARPSLALFDYKKGLLAGAVIPILQGRTWRVRSGLMATRAQRSASGPEADGLLWQADGTYAFDERTGLAGEIAYGNGGLSWRANLDLRRGPFSIHGESLSSNPDSPLVGIGAQSGGRKLQAIAIGWQPSTRFNANFSYNRAATLLNANSHRAALNHSNVFAGLTYNLSPRSRLGFRFNQQEIETSSPVLSSLLRLETRSAAITHNIRFAGGWSNDFEATATSSLEKAAGAQLERGLTFQEQLRRSFGRWSTTGYLNYTRNTPSLASLVVRNPLLLPPVLRGAYAEDPARFLIENRATLSSLLQGVELPLTRSFDLGFRPQGAFSRYNLTTEVRYSAGEIMAHENRRLSTTFNLSIRLDAANSLQVGGSRFFALNTPNGQSTLIVSYVHRFGSGGGDGFQFSRLFGLDRGKVQGRAFLDQNGNGEDDPGEPGIAGLTVQLDGDHSVTTDARGNFRFASIKPGEHNVALISEDLGVRLRASTAIEQRILVSARQTIQINYGLTNFGSVSGQIFNDLFLAGRQAAGNAPGIAGIRISLLSNNPEARDQSLTRTVDASGMYSFGSLPPGSYTLELDRTSVPPDFQLPPHDSWQVTVKPLQSLYLDIPLTAQRAVSGVAFIDKDGDGKFDPHHDEAVEGARVIAGRREVNTGSGGAYILRGLPAGRIELRAILPRLGAESRLITIELGPEPVTRRGVHIAIAPKKTAEEGK